MSGKIKDEDNYSHAFRENEKEANLYSARCTVVLAAVVALIWLLNTMGVFIVPAVIMNAAAAGAVLFFLLPSLIVRLTDPYSSTTKLWVLICCILGITLLSSALPKHAILAWAVPLVLCCHYYSKKFSYVIWAVSVVFMGISLVFGTLYGEWDSNLLGAVEEAGARIIDYRTVRRVVLYYYFPRSIILFGITVISATLSDRTRSLLECLILTSGEKNRIESELKVATHIQTSMLPSVFPAFSQREDFDIYATMMPAREVGGDFYDFYLVDEDHLAFLIADVSGKGVPAALFMVIAKTLIKDRAEMGGRADEVMETVNKLLCESNDEGLFVTAWLGVLTLSSGKLEYINAGHNPPLLKRCGKEYEYLRAKSGFVLAGLEDTKYRLNTTTLFGGDSIFLYTDGVTEAVNGRNELYGEERLLSVLNKNTGKECHDLIGDVKSDVFTFAGGEDQADDITMVSLTYHPAGKA